MSHRAWRGLGLGVLLALPALWAGWQWQVLLGSGWSSWLGANPVEATIHWSGLWAMRILIFTLALSPLAPETLGVAARTQAAVRACGLWLRDGASSALCRARSGVGAAGDPARTYQALVSDPRDQRLAYPGAAGRHVDARLDDPPQETVAHSALGVYPAAALAVTHEALVGKVLSTEAAVSISIVVLLAALRLYGAARRRLPALKPRAMRDARPATR
nr:hypothetical protein [Hankyongella ginsenosidimutans]